MSGRINLCLTKVESTFVAGGGVMFEETLQKKF